MAMYTDIVTSDGINISHVLHGLLTKFKDDNGHGEINIVIVDGEVKFINETYKNKY